MSTTSCCISDAGEVIPFMLSTAAGWHRYKRVFVHAEVEAEARASGTE